MAQQPLPKILIVEDEAPIRTLISFACAGAGFEVESCDGVIAAQTWILKNLTWFCLTTCCRKSPVSNGSKNSVAMRKPDTSPSLC